MAASGEPINLNIAPGIFTEASARGAQNRWHDGNRVRFRKGLPEKIGGWVKAHQVALTGCSRNALAWRTVTTDPIIRYIAFGSEKKLQLFDGDALYNITPIRDSGTLGADPLTTTISSPIVSVADTAHGLTVGSFATLGGATAVGGITPDGEYPVTAVTDANAYTITHSSNATSSATGGGASVTYSYQINIGAKDTEEKLGFGVGPFGEEGFGDERGTSLLLTTVRTWALDKWGEDLICNPRGGAIYQWDASGGTGTEAVIVTNAPITAQFIVVSPEDRHLIAFGAHDGSNDDPLNIRWSDQNDNTDWTPTDTNTAGDKRIDAGNEIISAIKSRGEIVFWTDLTVHSMFFSGPPFTFDFRQAAGESCGIVGPNARAEHQGVVYYMGCEDFYTFDGEVRLLPCDVRNHVFENLNDVQISKVAAGVNVEFGEIWWLYPSDEPNLENDLYVTYNYESGVWAIGAVDRLCWIDRNVLYNKPVAVDTSGFILNHEVGINDLAMAMDWFLESFTMQDGGKRYVQIAKMVPDFLTLQGTMELRLKSRRYPNGPITTKGPELMNSATEKVDIRARGRQIALRLEANEINMHFRMDDWQALGHLHGER